MNPHSARDSHSISMMFSEIVYKIVARIDALVIRLGSKSMQTSR